MPTIGEKKLIHYQDDPGAGWVNTGRTGIEGPNWEFEYMGAGDVGGEDYFGGFLSGYEGDLGFLTDTITGLESEIAGYKSQIAGMEGATDIDIPKDVFSTQVQGISPEQREELTGKIMGMFDQPGYLGTTPQAQGPDFDKFQSEFKTIQRSLTGTWGEFMTKEFGRGMAGEMSKLGAIGMMGGTRQGQVIRDVGRAVGEKYLPEASKQALGTATELMKTRADIKRANLAASVDVQKARELSKTETVKHAVGLLTGSFYVQNPLEPYKLWADILQPWFGGGGY